MRTKSHLFFACGAFMVMLLLPNVQITPTLADHITTAHRITGIHHMQQIAFKSQPNTPLLETVIISISGTTNSCAQILFVRNNGSVVYLACKTRKYIILSKEFTSTFFQDIHTSLPLNTLPANHGCLKSASFGSYIYLILQTQKSPDVSCSSDHLGEALYKDVKAIQAILHLIQLPPQPFSIPVIPPKLFTSTFIQAPAGSGARSTQTAKLLKGCTVADRCFS